MKKIILSLMLILSISATVPAWSFAAEPAYEGDPCVTDRSVTPPLIYVCQNGTVCNTTLNRCEKPISQPLVANDLFQGGPPGVPGGNLKGTLYAIENHLGSQGGGIPLTVGMMGVLYSNKPASTAIAFKDFKESLGMPAKTAYAQGFGFESLNPILGLWRLFRNMALGGFVIIFVVIGTMVMLRKNIDPRTVITVQQAIPKIIVSLILVIFSYSICGLLVDGVTVLSKGGLLFLQSNGLLARANSSTTTTAPMAVNKLLKANVFELFDNLYNMDVLLDQLTSLNITDDQGAGGFDVLVKLFQLGGSGSILRTVLWIAIFIAMLRTFFMLLTAYLTVVLKIIFSPFQFLMMAIPGSGGSLGGWFTGMLKHLLVFPVVFFMLALAAIFNARAGTNLWYDSPGEKGHPNIWNVGPLNGGNDKGIFPQGSANFWSPPALGAWGAATGPLLSLAILLTIPRTAMIVGKSLDSRHQPGAAEGAVTGGLQEAAGRIPILKNYVR